MISAMLDAWVAAFDNLQPLIASLLTLLASIILAIGIVKAAKIRTAANRQISPVKLDLRTQTVAEDGASWSELTGHLQRLRNLVRWALSALSAVDGDNDTARSLCARIAALNWPHLPLPTSADPSMRESYSAFLHQFELLQKLLQQQWSSSEASSILILLNAHARGLESSVQTLRADSGPSYSRKRE